jgi:signal transduction histidine kinase
MHDPTGASAGRIFAFRDVSADRIVEQIKTTFVSTVSQELRRPLTSIYGFSETSAPRRAVLGGAGYKLHRGRGNDDRRPAPQRGSARPGDLEVE